VKPMNRIKLVQISFFIIAILLSIINYESDLFKFLFTGYSSTYDVIMIRHSPYLTLTLLGSAIILSIVKKRKNVFWFKYPIYLILVLWFFSMRTSAFVYTDGTLISGWSFVKIVSCKCLINIDTVEKIDIENCKIDFDPVLNRKLKDILNP
jgi:hypothetical protein